jgi:2-phosphosulfolactate phosphatase
MEARVVLRPDDLEPNDIRDRAVVVFDVLRATTSMTAALAAGIRQIHIFGSLDAARAAAKAPSANVLLCGEQQCLAQADFHLGNSPGGFTSERCGGQTAFMSTTYGSRAIVAAADAAALFIGALVNASVVARAVAATGLPVTLLCAGTDGQVAMEDTIGAGAVLDALGRIGPCDLRGDTALMARRLFEGSRNDLPGVLSECQGGRNIVAAGLAEDIDFAARLDVFDLVGRVDRPDLIVLRA